MPWRTQRYQGGWYEQIQANREDQGEIAFDFIGNGTDPNDSHPWSGNIKVGTPEDSLFKFFPAIAVGGYNPGPS